MRESNTFTAPSFVRMSSKHLRLVFSPRLYEPTIKYRTPSNILSSLPLSNSIYCQKYKGGSFHNDLERYWLKKGEQRAGEENEYWKKEKRIVKKNIADQSNLYCDAKNRQQSDWRTCLRDYIEGE